MVFCHLRTHLLGRHSEKEREGDKGGFCEHGSRVDAVEQSELAIHIDLGIAESFDKIRSQLREYSASLDSR
jgi:hypothetical protein